MRRSLAALTLLLTATVAAAPAGAATRCSTAPTSWVAGSVDLCRGTLVYSDYVEDDYGADTGAVNTTSRSASLMPSAGDEGYPEGEDATADLIRLTLRSKGKRLLVSGLLNALYHPRSTVLAVAIDTDSNPKTGKGGKWGALDVSSRGWNRIAFLRAGNVRTNTITGSMPLPPGNRWRVQAVTAIAQ